MVCKKFPWLPLFLGVFLLIVPAFAQETQTSDGDPPGMTTMPGMSMVDMNPAGMFLMNLASDPR